MSSEDHQIGLDALAAAALRGSVGPDGQPNGDWRGMETLIAALQSNGGQSALELTNGLPPSTPTSTSQPQAFHPPPTPQYSQATLNALLAQPNILSILSLLPPPPLPDPNAAPVHTRSGRPSRPPQHPDEHLLQLQQAAWAGLDPSFLEALNNGAASMAAQASAGGVGAGGGGLDAMLSGAVNGSGDVAGAAAPEDSQLDWWWPIQEEGEDEDPSYFPPSTNTPSAHLQTPSYVFTPSAFVDESALAYDTNPHARTSSGNAHASGSGTGTGFVNGYGHIIPGGGGPMSEAESTSTVGPTKRPPKRTRKGKEKATSEQPEGGARSRASGTSRRSVTIEPSATGGSTAGGSPPPPAEKDKGPDKSKMTKAELAELRRETNKRTALESRLRAKEHVTNLEKENKLLRTQLATAKKEIEKLKLLIPPPSAPPRETFNIYDPNAALPGSSPPPHPFAELPPTPPPRKRIKIKLTKLQKQLRAEERAKLPPVEPEHVDIAKGKLLTGEGLGKGAGGWEMVDATSDEEEEVEAEETEDEQPEVVEEEEDPEDSDYPEEEAEQKKRDAKEKQKKRKKKQVSHAARAKSRPRRGSTVSRGFESEEVEEREDTAVAEPAQEKTQEGEAGSAPSTANGVAAAPNTQPEEVEPSSDVDMEDDDDDDDDDEEDDEPRGDGDDSEDDDLYLPIRDVPIPTPPPGAARVDAAGGAGGGAEALAGLAEAATAGATGGVAGGPGNKEVVDLLKALLAKMGGSA